MIISRSGTVNWPPRSFVLTPLDYALWGYLKSLVNADKPETIGKSDLKLDLQIRLLPSQPWRLYARNNI